MIRDIVVNLSVNGKRDVVRDYALSVASAFQSHVTAVAVNYELAAFGIASEGSAALEAIQAQMRENENAANAAKSQFEEGVRRSGLSGEARVFKATLTVAAAGIGRIARTADLAIVGQPEATERLAGSLVIESILFGAGRPMIVVPYIQKQEFRLDHVTVCWDGSRAAARAAADALPLLRKSKAIELLVVETDRGSDIALPGADMAEHLARHGLKVELSRMSVPDVDVANAILSRVADTSSNLVVMGGYGHSRLREFVLGGVTRGMLSEMTVPVLMSH